MKRITFLSTVRTIAGTLLMMVVLSSCTKEGPTGATGKDANETCKTCHSATSGLDVKIGQFENSLHGSGEAWAYAGGRDNCAPCHSTSGFLEVIAKSTPHTNYKVSLDVANKAMPISCRTCHAVHANYDSTDWKLTTTTGFTMMFDTVKNYKYDMGNNSNLCARCHQPRPVKAIDMSQPTAKYSGITSSHWGTHYGTQAAIITGQGGIALDGTIASGASSHGKLTCVTCHSAPSGAAGGHTFNAAGNTAGCKACHADISPQLKTLQSSVDALMAQLEAKLDPYLQKDDAGKYTGYANYGKFPGDVSNKTAAALVNYMLVFRDRSKGVHNIGYTKALLQNTIDNL